jgi:hypothetical protein
MSLIATFTTTGSSPKSTSDCATSPKIIQRGINSVSIKYYILFVFGLAACRAYVGLNGKWAKN